jgi:hypothetical protein
MKSPRNPGASTPNDLTIRAQVLCGLVSEWVSEVNGDEGLRYVPSVEEYEQFLAANAGLPEDELIQRACDLVDENERKELGPPDPWLAEPMAVPTATVTVPVKGHRHHRAGHRGGRARRPAARRTRRSSRAGPDDELPAPRPAAPAGAAASHAHAPVGARTATRRPLRVVLRGEEVSMLRQRVYMHDGAIYALPDPGQFNDPEVQLAVAWRNQATLSGRCPACAGRGPNRAERRRIAREGRGWVTEAVFTHAQECPASDERLVELIRAAAKEGAR